MGKVRKIVNGVVVEINDNEMVRTIENGVVVEKKYSELKKKEQSTNNLRTGTSNTSQSKSQSTSSDVNSLFGNSITNIVTGKLSPIEQKAATNAAIARSPIFNTNEKVKVVNTEQQELESIVSTPLADNIGVTQNRKIVNTPSYNEKKELERVNSTYNKALSNEYVSKEDLERVKNYAPEKLKSITKALAPSVDNEFLGSGESLEAISKVSRIKKEIDFDYENANINPNKLQFIKDNNPDLYYQYADGIASQLGIEKTSDPLKLANAANSSIIYQRESRNKDYIKEAILKRGIDVNIEAKPFKFGQPIENKVEKPFELSDLSTFTPKKDYDLNDSKDVQDLLSIVSAKDNNDRYNYVQNALNEARAKNKLTKKETDAFGNTTIVEDRYAIQAIESAAGIEYDKANEDITISRNLLNRKITKLEVEKHFGQKPINEYTSNELIEAGMIAKKYNSRTEYESIKRLTEDIFDENDKQKIDFSNESLKNVIGSEASYNLEKEGLDVLRNIAKERGNYDLLQKVSEDEKSLNFKNKEYAVSKALDIVAAYNHQKDSDATLIPWRTRPTLKTATEWLRNPDLVKMFDGNEDLLTILKEEFKNNPSKYETEDGKLNIKVGGLMNTTLASVGNSIRGLFNFLDGNYGDIDRIKENLNPNISGESWRKDLGQINSEFQQEYFQLSEKIKNKDADEGEIKRHSQLKGIVDNRTKLDKLADGTGNFTGQIIMMAAGTKGLDKVLRLGKLAEMGKKTRDILNSAITNQALFYDGTRKQSLSLFPDDSIKSFFHTQAMMVANYATEKIFADEKVLAGARAFLGNRITQRLSELTTQNVSEASLRNIVQESIMSFGKNINQEALEETISQVVDEGLQYSLGQRDYDGSKAVDRILETYTQTLINGGVVGALATKNDMASKFGRSTIMNATLEYDKSKKELEQLHLDNKIDKADFNSRMQILNTSKALLDAEPEKVKEMSIRKRAAYLTHGLNIKLNETKIEPKADANGNKVFLDENEKKEALRNIEESTKKREAIYSNTDTEYDEDQEVNESLRDRISATTGILETLRNELSTTTDENRKAELEVKIKEVEAQVPVEAQQLIDTEPITVTPKEKIDFNSKEFLDIISNKKIELPEGYTTEVSKAGEDAFGGKINVLDKDGNNVGFVEMDYDYSKNEYRINKSELNETARGKGIANKIYNSINETLQDNDLGVLKSDNRGLTQDAIKVWERLVLEGKAKKKDNEEIGYEFINKKSPSNNEGDKANKENNQNEITDSKLSDFDEIPAITLENFDEITSKYSEKIPELKGYRKTKESIDAANRKINEYNSNLQQRRSTEPSSIEEDAMQKAQAEIDNSSNDTENNPSSANGDVVSAIIEIDGKTYEGKNHAEAILNAKNDGKDISNVDRQAEGKFKLKDGSIIDRNTAQRRFGASRAEQLIPQDENSKNANKEYAKQKSKYGNVEETYYNPLESEGAALERLSKGLTKEDKDQFEQRAKEHVENYRNYINEQGGLTDESAKKSRVEDFEAATAMAINDYFDNTESWQKRTENTFQNGARIDENGNKLSEEAYIKLKEKVRALNLETDISDEQKDANAKEVAEINANPNKYYNENFDTNTQIDEPLTSGVEEKGITPNASTASIQEKMPLKNGDRYTDSKGVERIWGENVEADKSYEIDVMMKATAEGAAMGATIQSVEDFKKGKEIVFRKPQSIEAAINNNSYNVEIQEDGSAKVIGVLDPRNNEWVGQAPNTTTVNELPQDIKDKILSEAKAFGVLAPTKEQLGDSETANELLKFISEQGKDGLLEKAYDEQDMQDLIDYAQSIYPSNVDDSFGSNIGEDGQSISTENGASLTIADEYEQEDSAEDILYKNYELPLGILEAKNASKATDLLAGYTSDVLEQEDMVDSLVLKNASIRLNQLILEAKNIYGDSILDVSKGLRNGFKNLKDDINKLGAYIKLKNELFNEIKDLKQQVQELRRLGDENAEIASLNNQINTLQKEFTIVNNYVDKQSGEASKKLALNRLTRAMQNNMTFAYTKKASVVGVEVEKSKEAVEEALEKDIDDADIEQNEEDTKDAEQEIKLEVNPKGKRKTPSSEMISKTKSSINKMKVVGIKHLAVKFNKVLNNIGKNGKAC